ncbi:HlyD family secretion protein [Kaistia dalseonensis]|uniref:Membrane fusion protein (Multidrug efflux system) n=1 Tax=Kaistia dalseonensis TaxID=410840 RepID=A0ABU0HA09_9HYPH|nr:HlyD family secretion protein [Kaistia dalseonensis]MCX5495718.1 HlyD family secretion protein [Kaistia dalseonensis]MDQ0438314.1 membrane fusion protein (multidrug efflux system) [Kaistia dalseonensis]
MNAVIQPAELKLDATPPAPKPLIARRAILAVAVIAVLGVGAYLGWQYWAVWRFEQATDDAYVQADVVAIAPQVAGYLASVEVADNQHVKAGDVLATIDQRDYQAAVDQASADVAQAQAAIAGVGAELNEQHALISEATATINADQAAELYAEQNNRRFGTLATNGFGTVQDAQQATSQINAAKATVTKDQAALAAATAQIDTLNAQRAAAEATLQHNQAALDKAKLNLGYTVLRAPVDGVVGMRQLRVGLYVQPGQQLLALVPLGQTYIVANYKETQLADVYPGQPVRIDVDTFAGTPVRGKVQSIAPASGQEFALLPPDNATGNFTKIVQRIPVKIAIDRTDPLAGRLLPGMSVTTTIEVGPTSQSK